MQRGLNNACIRNDCTVENSITYLVGSSEILDRMQSVSANLPFDDNVLNFLNDVSKRLMARADVKEYSDLVAFAFWIRKSATLKLKGRFCQDNGNIYMGRGVAFHIAPSNVPVNYAYSLATGLLTGNANIVRVPSKNFPQIEIINDVINETLEKHKEIKPYICLVRYERNQMINEMLSLLADVRIVWGGDATIAEIRKSPLSPRAGEITFADRFSIAVIDSEVYMNRENKSRIAEAFYNDTYLTDQNACTSPRIVVWVGSAKEDAKRIFWHEFHELVAKKYVFQSIQGIDKLSKCYLLAAVEGNIKLNERADNLIFRVSILDGLEKIMEFKGNSGYFFEYDCDDILELKELCNDKHCQTVAYLGNKSMLYPLLKSGVKGIDHIVPIGRTMDFDLIWDGYNLFERLVRIIKIDD